MKQLIILSNNLKWISLLLLVWLTGCRVSPGITGQQSLKVLLTQTATEPPLSTPISPVASPTNILSTKTFTPAVVMTPTLAPQTPTPLPTLSADEARIALLDLLQTNSGCQLPCWWSLIPGKTSSLEAKSFLEQFGSLSNYYSVFDEKGGAIYLEIPVNNLIARPRVEYVINTDKQTIERLSISIDIVRKIEGGYEVVYGDPLFAKLLPSYTLSEILSKYGQPSVVLVRGIRNFWEFDLLLSYAEAGFLINYSAPFENKNGTYFGCPSKANVELWLWPPERDYSLPEAAEAIFGKYDGRAWLATYLSLQDATSVSPEIFYKTYKIPENTSCLETPLELWPEP